MSSRTGPVDTSMLHDEEPEQKGSGQSSSTPLTLVFTIPAFNEEEAIAQTIHSIRKFTNHPDRTVVIIVIDDCSTDQTRRIARESGATIVYSHSENRNVAGAFQSAICLARRYNPDVVCNFDADGQFSADEIENVLTPILLGNADLIVGSRFLTKNNIPPIKRIGNMIFSSLLSLITGYKITDASSGFRAFSRAALAELSPLGLFTYTHESILDVVAARLVYNEVPVSVRYFGNRQSRVVKSILEYTLKSLGVMALKLIQLNGQLISLRAGSRVK